MRAPVKEHEVLCGVLSSRVLVLQVREGLHAEAAAGPHACLCQLVCAAGQHRTRAPRHPRHYTRLHIQRHADALVQQQVLLCTGRTGEQRGTCQHMAGVTASREEDRGA
eukprot:7995923-Pyramimonas_sp.AAC.1